MSDTAEQACPGAAGGDPSPLSFSDPLRQAWAELLGRYRWQWFCTLTFREAIHPEAASKAFRYWVNLLNTDLWGVRWRRRQDAGVHWVCALEWQKRGVLHFHALLGCSRDLNLVASRSHYADLWNEIAGFARLDPIEDESGAVCGYVSKYVSKGGQIDVSRNVGSSEFWPTVASLHFPGPDLWSRPAAGAGFDLGRESWRGGDPLAVLIAAEGMGCAGDSQTGRV